MEEKEVSETQSCKGSKELVNNGETSEKINTKQRINDTAGNVASLLERKEVDPRLTWDLSQIFKSEEDFESSLQEAIALATKIAENYKGKLYTAFNINQCLNLYNQYKQIVSPIWVYGYLALAEDTNNTDNYQRYTESVNTLAQLESRLAFIKSEIAVAEDEAIDQAIKQSKENSNYLLEILRLKRHSLDPKVEEVLLALNSTLNAPYNIYNKVKLADMKFDSFVVEGKEHPLSVSLYENKWEFELDTDLRRGAFKAFYSKLEEYQHTMAAVYQTQVLKEKTLADLKGFKSVIDYLLFNQQVDRELYDRQIDLSMERLAPHMRKYARFLQKIHKLDKMTYADLKLSVDPSYNLTIELEDARDLLLMALAPLGNDYLEMVMRGFDERWIDFPQNKGKQTGAFCSCSYDSHPYILISWTGTMRDVFILAHELGHAGHFYLTHQNQNIFDSRPSSYFVEAPSTMNELLLAHYLLESNKDIRLQRWVLASLIGQTYYHNFVTHLLEAAFQREVYKVVDKYGSIQAQTLNGIKREVLEKFWGDAVEISEGAELTWMRQPHYYMGLYPYTYSAGLTIATEVCKVFQRDQEFAVKRWRRGLMAGGIKPPVDLAKIAGVDLSTEKPLIDTIDYVGALIDEIIGLS